MADFKLDRIRFNWKGSWQPSATYVKDDIVEYQGSTYVCLVGHSANASSFYSDYGSWQQKLHITVDRNLIDTANVYYVNGEENPELSLRRGLTYVFNLDDSSNDGHAFLISASSDGTHVNGGFLYPDGVEYYLDKTLVTSSAYIAGFDSATYREVRVTVADDAINLYYFCHYHTGMGNQLTLDTDAIWELQAQGTTWKGDWQLNTYYQFGDIAQYGGVVYLCQYPHISASTFSNGLEVDIASWITLAKFVAYKGSWLPATRYKIDDIVKAGGVMYKCIQGHTSSASYDLGLNADISKWQVFLNSDQYLQDWQTATVYVVNDIVKEGGSLWKCILHHTATDFQSDFIAGGWELYLDGVEDENAWVTTTYYQIGDVVSYGGYRYRAKLNSQNVRPLETDSATWEQLSEAYNFREDYSYDSATDYYVGDTVRHNGILYTAIQNVENIEPPSPTHWKVVVPGTFWTGQWQENQEYKLNDLVTYGSNTHKVIRPHLGTSDKRPDLDLLAGGIYYELYAEGFPTNVLTTRGDLITYANDPTNLNKTRFGRGLQGEILSSTGTSLEWTSADVVAKVFYVSQDGTDTPDNGKSMQSPFRSVKYAADYIRNNESSYMFNTVPYNTTAGNQDTYVLTSAILELDSASTLANATNLQALLESINPNTGFAYGDIDQNGSITVADSAYFLRYESQTGSINTKEQNDAIKDVIDYIEANFEDFVGEYVTHPDAGNIYLIYTSYPNTTIFVKTGYYEEVLPISLPRNCALVGDELRSTIVTPAVGYESSKMFYVNSGCGIRNMSLQGLTDILGSDNAYLTKRPTLDATYVSLDPGTGPDDESVWIYKSPYVQNVSTFGTGVTGLKIDGDLHNGGYDSVVANDFTQVLSDGIGVWCTNRARTELVSVFTYYNHIGYLAENGGKIRGTNGNNSYGKYGSVAEGVDTTETAISATINNRSTEAQISSVFTDGFDDILVFEYSNAGSEYTSASYAISGTGTNASISSANVSNGGIYEIRLTGIGENPLGAGYLTVQGNAQDGPVDTAGNIKISQADANTIDNYLGMRIVIIAGAGAGQYGYITSYDIATKDMVIARESDGVYGWDHVVPGRALQIPDSTSRYQIEPRVICPEPASGTKAFIRLSISGGGLGEFKIIDPGSGYSLGTPPTILITDPNRTSTGSYEVRVSNGVLGQPTWNDRGNGYVSAIAAVSGDGYADRYQTGAQIHVSGMTNLPGPGANVELPGDSTIYRLVAIDDVTGSLGNQAAKLTISPLLDAVTAPEHLASVTIRESYSQVRLTGHDFLDIGSGNIVDTDYPIRYVEGYTSINEPTQSYEAVDSGGGRVFYTSTDQDGNFRVGELFEVEQATGIITLNADAFELGGLEELRLGGVRLGGTSATVREFSTDATLSANSDEIVPTQKAIRAYIESRIGGGSANLQVVGVVAGQVEISGNSISTEANRIEFNADVALNGGVSGTYLQQALFLGN